MSSAITNAAQTSWTYFGTFTDQSYHELPTNWSELYLVSGSDDFNRCMPLWIIKDFFPVSTQIKYMHSNAGNSFDQITIDITNNRLRLDHDYRGVKVYYR